MKTVVPYQTLEQRRANLELAREARLLRSKLLYDIESGERSRAEVVAQGRVHKEMGRLKAYDLLMTIPGIGDSRAAQVLTALGIAHSRRLAGLGHLQRERFILWLQDKEEQLTKKYRESVEKARATRAARQAERESQAQLETLIAACDCPIHTRIKAAAEEGETTAVFVLCETVAAKVAELNEAEELQDDADSGVCETSAHEAAVCDPAVCETSAHEASVCEASCDAGALVDAGEPADPVALADPDDPGDPCEAPSQPTS